MNRRGLLVAIVTALTATASFAQEPIVFGVITPLSPPGETGLGQLVKRGSEIAFRTHAVDPPRAATWLGWAKKNGFKRMSILAETTDYGIGLAKATEAQNKSMNIALEIQTIMFDRTTTDLLPQLLQVKAFNP